MSAGYAVDLEDRDFLASLDSGEQMMAEIGDYQEVRLDPRKLIRIENQGQQGSCQGHSLSSCVEWCYTIATLGQVQQLSRAYAYYESQRTQNPPIVGDRGSTISAGVRLALSQGICEETLWPYPSNYNPARPKDWTGVLDNAKQYKIARAIKISTFAEWKSFLGSGQGGINLGISWGQGMNNAIVENFSSGGGGHAIAALCLSERVDASGNPYTWIANSWGEGFGSREYKGWCEFSPRAVQQMLVHNWTEAIGLTELTKPRKFSLDEWKKGLRV